MCVCLEKKCRKRAKGINHTKDNQNEDRLINKGSNITSKMQIERIIADVETLGPGKRICIWVNGCKRRCKGCVSPELQAFQTKNECDVVGLLKKFRPNASTAITVSGGEPFEQTTELAELVKYLRGCGVEDILVYTGYTVEELRARETETENTLYILNNIGVLIDGPYIDELNFDVGNLKGSENQRVIFMNPRLKKKYGGYTSDVRKMQEYYVFPHVVGVGIPTKEYVKKF